MAGWLAGWLLHFLDNDERFLSLMGRWRTTMTLLMATREGNVDEVDASQVFIIMCVLFEVLAGVFNATL